MNFTIGQRNHGYNTRGQKCTQHVGKENPLLLKDVIGTVTIKYTNMWVRY